MFNNSFQFSVINFQALLPLFELAISKDKTYGASAPLIVSSRIEFIIFAGESSFSTNPSTLRYLDWSCGEDALLNLSINNVLDNDLSKEDIERTKL